MSEEKYQFEIDKKGSINHDVLDVSFNNTTQEFILKHGLPTSKKIEILDVGCGTGVMTGWLCETIGERGHVTAVDNSASQVEATKKYLESKNIKNASYEVLSAYDLSKLNKKFDLIYCRFLLHHLNSPRMAVKIFYDLLNPRGIYIGEEGIIHAAFAYPPTDAWVGYMPNLKMPSYDKDGQDRDGDFGMKLFFYTRQAGFHINACNLVQPMLWKKHEKQLVLANSLAFKKTSLEHGTSEEQWQQQYSKLEACVQDDNQILAFYQSCQVAGVKL